MTTDNFWGDKTEYIERLANEVTDLKNVLVGLSQQVRRIERRIDLILPEKRSAKLSDASAGRERRAEKTPTMSETQARQTIDRLTQCLIDKKPIDAELRAMTMKHGLTPIAREFGMTNTKLPPKTELIMNIITRLRQSVMLTENIRKMSRVAEEEKQFGS
ncbi:hypothetical protein [Candidatus Spongiihabitans sp.]|uniref:hypothetical protein n=1 Tax=Candidatus Spongiihabitans sp. TaxID=3101308 RepID=UPI003C7DA0CB